MKRRRETTEKNRMKERGELKAREEKESEQRRVRCEEEEEKSKNIYLRNLLFKKKKFTIMIRHNQEAKGSNFDRLDLSPSKLGGNVCTQFW